jgi:hypothetical protein
MKTAGKISDFYFSNAKSKTIEFQGFSGAKFGFLFVTDISETPDFHTAADKIIDLGPKIVAKGLSERKTDSK